MITASTAIALANTVIAMQYPLIGVFVYSQPIASGALQVTTDLQKWYDVPMEDITILPNGDWAVSPNQPYIVGPMNKTLPTDYRFYRIVQRP